MIGSDYAPCPFEYDDFWELKVAGAFAEYILQERKAKRKVLLLTLA
jgi:hypothetical protein